MKHHVSLLLAATGSITTLLAACAAETLDAPSGPTTATSGGGASAIGVGDGAMAAMTASLGGTSTTTELVAMATGAGDPGDGSTASGVEPTTIAGGGSSSGGASATGVAATSAAGQAAAMSDAGGATTIGMGGNTAGQLGLGGADTSVAGGSVGGESAGGMSGINPGGGGAGTAGAPADGMGEDATATPSAGCGMTTNQGSASWVESMVMSGNGNRPYSVWLPNDYDPMRAYPVIVLLHGCGSGTNNVPLERETGTDAILIRGTGSAADTCWDSSPNGTDVAFVDAMIADVQARFCTDTARFFAVGYSSGSWLVDQLACIRADVLRGLATVAGGNPGVRNCVGPIAQIFVHDMNDTSNSISGSESARDRLLMENNCDTSIDPVPEDPSPCVRYQGCDPGYPVVWCATSGEGHNRQDNLTAPAFWNFFQEF